jgi:predicted nucleotidyltransferase
MYSPAECGELKRGDVIVHLRRLLILRKVIASGANQREAAAAAGISQSTVSRQLQSKPTLESIRPEVLLEAAAPVLKEMAESHGYCRLAVFGSLARGDAREDSDIDLLVDAPRGTSSFDFVRFAQLIEKVVGRKVDLISYGGLRSDVDSNVLREAILL